jgi:hypothetical protein
MANWDEQAYAALNTIGKRECLPPATDSQIIALQRQISQRADTNPDGLATFNFAPLGDKNPLQVRKYEGRIDKVWL